MQEKIEQSFITDVNAYLFTIVNIEAPPDPSLDRKPIMREPMKNHSLSQICRAILLLGAALPAITLAQDAPIPRDGNATPAQLEAEKKVALEFFRPGITPQERIALIDPSYVQHNPLFMKMAAENHVSDYEQFKRVFTLMAARQAGGSKGSADPGHPAPRPVIVMAECDLVTVVVKATVPDPTGAPGTNYGAFGWDTFRIRNGKIVEHWDGQLLSVKAVRMARAMEAPGGAPAAPGAASPIPATQK